MSNWHEQMATLKVRAQEAAERTTIDSVVGLGASVCKIGVQPADKDRRVFDQEFSDVDLVQAILARVPDLLTLATYAWYALQRDGEPSRYATILRAYGEENDMTSFPWWAICEHEMADDGDGPHKTGRVILVRGIWFSREAAANHLERKRYNYGPDAFVYCFSGCDSHQYRELNEMAQAEVGGPA